ADPELLRQRDAISEAAREWERSGRRAGLLVQEERLVQAEALSLGGLVDLNDAEQRYVHACVAAREAARVEREERRQRELDLQKKLTRKFQAATGVAALLMLVASAAGWYADRQRRHADAQTKKAQESEATAKTSEAKAKAQAKIATSRQLAALSV